MSSCHSCSALRPRSAAILEDEPGRGVKMAKEILCGFGIDVDVVVAHFAGTEQEFNDVGGIAAVGASAPGDVDEVGVRDLFDVEVFDAGHHFLALLDVAPLVGVDFLPGACGVFLVENLSVMMQVTYFKYTKRKYGVGKRIFLMSPLHHHYQKMGQHEAKIVTRFWIVTVLCVLASIVTLKLR